MNILVGADPEFFLEKENKIVASQPYLPGSKFEPYAVAGGGSVHRDNVMGEFGILPATSEDEFVHNISVTVNAIKKLIKPNDLHIKWLPHVYMDEEQLKHVEAWTFGCLPDRDCWERDNSQSADEDTVGTLRCAGGHVHLGFNFKGPSDKVRAARACDIHLGLGSVLFDNDCVRRKTYGRAGRYRKKSYGIEYRTLSNAWLQDEKLIRWVYRGAVKAVTVREGLDRRFGLTPATNIINAINYGDKKEAVKLMKHFDAEFPPC